MIHLYDANNVMLRDLDKIGHERIGLRRRFEQCNDGQTHIWVWDGRGHNNRRRDLYPAYKMNRLPMGEDRFAQIGVFREALTHSCAIQVDCDGWEGDDVIYTLALRFSRRSLPVTVWSNDGDYFQLAAEPGITLNGVRPLDCDPQHTPLFKATVGDSSDNIIGIAGFGPKTWGALSVKDREALQTAIEDQDMTAIAALPLPKRVLTKLAEPGKLAETLAALTITRFIPVPEPELEKGIRQGVLNRQAADQLFRRFFL